MLYNAVGLFHISRSFLEAFACVPEADMFLCLLDSWVSSYHFVSSGVTSRSLSSCVTKFLAK